MNKSTAARATVWAMVFSFIAKVAFPIVGIIVTGKIGSEAVGTFGIAVTLYTVAELFRDGGIANTLIADRDLEHGSPSLYHATSILLAALFAALCVVTASAIAGYYDLPSLRDAIYTVALCIGLGGLATVPTTMLVRDARFKTIGASDAWATGVGYAVALGLALKGFGLHALLVQMVVRNLIYLGLITRHAGWAGLEFDLGRQVHLIRISLANLASNVAYTVFTMGDYAAIGKLLGPAANGAYWVAYNLANKPLELIVAPISRTMMVALSKAKGDHEVQADRLSRTMRLLTMFTFPLYAFVAIFGSSVITLLYPREFAAAGPVLQVLSLYLFSRSVGSIASSALVVSGHAKKNAMAWIPGFAIAIGGFVWLYSWTRELFPYIATLSIAAFVVYALNIYLATRLLEFRTQHWRKWLSGFAVSMPALGTLGVVAMLPLPPLGRVLLALGACVIVHLGVVSVTSTGRWTSFASKRGLRAIYDGL